MATSTESFSFFVHGKLVKNIKIRLRPAQGSCQLMLLRVLQSFLSFKSCVPTPQKGVAFPCGPSRGVAFPRSLSRGVAFPCGPSRGVAFPLPLKKCYSTTIFSTYLLLFHTIMFEMQSHLQLQTAQSGLPKGSGVPHLDRTDRGMPLPLSFLK